MMTSNSQVKYIFSLPLLLIPLCSVAQSTGSNEDWLSSPGVLGTIALFVIILAVAALILVSRINRYLSDLKSKQEKRTRIEFKEELIDLDETEIDEILEKRKVALRYKLKGNELGSDKEADDERGIITDVKDNPENPYFEEKKKTNLSLETPEPLKKIVKWYIGTSVFWLVLGTLVGEYEGLKFVWPELDHLSFLSFGRLRPVHTNTVFWGWASFAMIGLAYFVIARTANRKIYSYKAAWWTWALMNLTVILGDLFLVAGVNNGGGEYREYIWPVTLLFAIGLIITFVNFYRTVARRRSTEIYISNWFILASLIWTIILTVIGYLPNYQNGLGETIIQGYYMHQGVGMWFMTFTLGLIYYYLPASLNKPIYSYALGVLAFWSQMLFYTMIGTHHFVFSPLPWWLQTIAIVFSVGMFIPVIAGTTNFLMTMRGSFYKLSRSYVLPFFLVGVVFYFVGSSQGSLEAFRSTNQLWHFTDFTVAHSHMTMYGIITFVLWACIYALVPKLTRREPPQVLVGAHFWLAFIGLFAYMMSMMIGGTLKGLSWIHENPFIQSVVLMKPYWAWRAVGGSLMFISHLVFALNFYLMVRQKRSVTHATRIVRVLSEGTDPQKLFNA